MAPESKDTVEVVEPRIDACGLRRRQVDGSGIIGVQSRLKSAIVGQLEEYYCARQYDSLDTVVMIVYS